jgi:hypothetical protein
LKLASRDPVPTAATTKQTCLNDATPCCAIYLRPSPAAPQRLSSKHSNFETIFSDPQPLRLPPHPGRRVESLLAAMDFPKRTPQQGERATGSDSPLLITPGSVLSPVRFFFFAKSSVLFVAHAGSRRRSPRASTPAGADENADPTHPSLAGNVSPLRKKVLAEMNCGGDGGGMVAATPPPQRKHVPSPPSLAGRGAGPYDPKTNYTEPRPEFLRYDPDCHREMLLRLARGPEVEAGHENVALVEIEFIVVEVFILDVFEVVYSPIESPKYVVTRNEQE